MIVQRGMGWMDAVGRLSYLQKAALASGLALSTRRGGIEGLAASGIVLFYQNPPSAGSTKAIPGSRASF